MPEKMVSFIYDNYARILLGVLLAVFGLWVWLAGGDTDRELDRIVEDNRRAGSAIETAREQAIEARDETQRARAITRELLDEIKDSREIIDRLKANNSRAREIVEGALRQN